MRFCKVVLSFCVTDFSDENLSYLIKHVSQGHALFTFLVRIGERVSPGTP